MTLRLGLHGLMAILALTTVARAENADFVVEVDGKPVKGVQSLNFQSGGNTKPKIQLIYDVSDGSALHEWAAEGAAKAKKKAVKVTAREAISGALDFIDVYSNCLPEKAGPAMGPHGKPVAGVEDLELECEAVAREPSK